MPTTLRRHLKIEGETVWLDCYKGRINLYSDAEYEKRKLGPWRMWETKLKRLERLGLK